MMTEGLSTTLPGKVHVRVLFPDIAVGADATIVPTQVTVTNRFELVACPHLMDAHLWEVAEDFFMVAVSAAHQQITVPGHSGGKPEVITRPSV